jgi:hypothetical protein
LKTVYDHYDFLRRLTQKRYKDAVLADEAYSYALEGLAQNDWRRVRAYQGKSSFQRYLGTDRMDLTCWTKLSCLLEVVKKPSRS